MPGLILEKPDGGSEGLRSRILASRAYLVLSLLAVSLAAAMIPLGLMADGPGSDSGTGAAAKANSAPFFIIPGSDAAQAGRLAANTGSIRASELVIESVAVRPAGSHRSGPSIVNPYDKVYRQGETISPFAIHVSGEPVSVGIDGLPDGLTYAGGTVSGTVPHDAAAGAYVVTITASDGASADSTAFGIAVLEVERGGIMGAGTSPMMAGLLAALAGALALAFAFAWMRRRAAA